MALKQVKVKHHIVHLQDILSKVFYCQIARGKWENGVKKMYCWRNSVFKCLSQILKELFVLEETC